jgi:hypothetical protein
MSEKKQKIWCGRGKESGQYGQIKFNICLDNIPQEFISEFQGKRYVKLILSKKREPDEKGNSHGVEVDTWKPDSSKKTETVKTIKEIESDDKTTDLPF